MGRRERKRREGRIVLSIVVPLLAIYGLVHVIARDSDGLDVAALTSPTSVTITGRYLVVDASAGCIRSTASADDTLTFANADGNALGETTTSTDIALPFVAEWGGDEIRICSHLDVYSVSLPRADVYALATRGAPGGDPVTMSYESLRAKGFVWDVSRSIGSPLDQLRAGP